MPPKTRRVGISKEKWGGVLLQQTLQAADKQEKCLLCCLLMQQLHFEKATVGANMGMSCS